MQRLLADAQKLTGVKYDISNLGDVYEAIHVIQGELGLTGVAAEEAQTTLAGSANAMKASWTNVMAAITTGEGLDVAMSNLGQTVGYFLNNVLIMAGNVLTQFPALISGIAEVISANAPMLLASGSELVMQLVNGVVAGVPAVITGISGLILQLVQAISANGPGFLTSGMELIGQLVLGVISTLPTIATTAAEAVNTLLVSFTTNAPSLITAGGNLLQQVVTGLVTALPQIVASAVQILGDLLMAFLVNAPTLIAGGIEMIVQLANGLVQSIPTLVEQVPVIFQNMADAFLSTDWASIGNAIIEGVGAGIKAAAGALLEAAKSVGAQALSALKSMFGIASPSKVFRDEVGRWIPAGVALGIEQNLSPVRYSVRSMAATASAEMRRAASPSVGFDQVVSQTPRLGQNVPQQPQKIVIEFTGNLAQLGRLLQPHIKAEEQRRGPQYVN